MQAGQALRTAANTVSPGPTWTVAGTAAAVAVASGGFSPVVAAALISVAGALGTVVATWQQRRISAAVLTGAAGTVLADLAVLNVHMSPAVSSVVLTAVSVVVGALMHLAVVKAHEAPVPAPAAAPPVAPHGPVVAPPSAHPGTQGASGSAQLQYPRGGAYGIPQSGLGSAPLVDHGEGVVSGPAPGSQATPQPDGPGREAAPDLSAPAPFDRVIPPQEPS